MSFNLTGVAFITGAGGALGRAVTLAFAKNGVSKIAGLDVDPKGLEGTAAALKADSPATEFLPLTADLTSEDQVKQAFDKVISTFGRIDYAINNAGIGGPLVPTAELEPKDFDKVIAVNVKGVWLCSKYELKQMVTQTPLRGPPFPGLQAQRGAIVNISSVLGLSAMPTQAPYSSSKHAILGLTKADALDYALQGIRVNAVCPGFIETPLLTPAIRQALAKNIEKTPLKRLALPEEIANAVCFLVSEAASYVTGLSLPVDGGYTIN